MKTRNIQVTMECFIRKNDRYLMLHRASGKRIMPGVWMAPGGKREFNEGLFEATRREVLEETGLKIKNLRVKATGNAYLKDLDEEFYFHFVMADYVGGTLRQAKTIDGEFKWLTVTEMLALPQLLAEIKEIGTSLFDQDSTVLSYKAVYEKGNKLSFFELEKG